jgi:hypothetical protein
MLACGGGKGRGRDIHTVAQQLQGRQNHYDTVEQYLLDFDPGNPMWQWPITG